jgi:hypothetical protein
MPAAEVAGPVHGAHVMTRRRTPPDDPPPSLTKEQASAVINRAILCDADGRFVVSDAEALRALAALEADQEPDPPPATPEETIAELRRQLRFEQKSVEDERRARLAQTQELLQVHGEMRQAHGKLRRRTMSEASIQKARLAVQWRAEGKKWSVIASRLKRDDGSGPMTARAVKELVRRYKVAQPGLDDRGTD